MKTLPHKTRWRILLAVTAAVNLALWIFPSDVVTLIARDRHVLLGRYSREHLTWIIGVGVISAVVLLIGAGVDDRGRRRRALGVVTACLAVFLPTCTFDLILRINAPDFYIKDTLAYHRPAMFKADVDPRTGDPIVIRDLPEAARSYPVLPAGYPEFAATLTSDARGFRNQTDLPQYDIVALGDSFAEGSKVSDEHPWPRRLAESSGQSVYNLGMSGYAPQNYLASLKEVGLSLNPKTVVCMVYEENDFRAAELREEPESELSKFFKQSPILQMLDGAIVRGLGRVHATGNVKGIEVLSWLPIRVPQTEAGKSYAFSPTLVLDLYQTPEKLKATSQWKAITKILVEMNEACAAAGARFVLIYTPSKPHVLLPIAGKLPVEKFRAFAELRAKETLPPPAEFYEKVLASLDVKETLTREFCESKAIPFVSLTEVLRKSAASGEQVYFTYDDHFSPKGHEVAALAVTAFLAGDSPPAPVAEPDGGAPVAPPRPAVTALDGP
ncbi:MAG: hypothetical protein IT449_02930 [Phycisphaerales bacterium]|nr:hypothetical protein [Phycisphaerales bacterium]